MYVKRKWQLSLTSFFWQLQEKAEQLRINLLGLARKNKKGRNLGKLTKTGKASLKNKCCSNNQKDWSAFINFEEAAGFRLQPRT